MILFFSCSHLASFTVSRENITSSFNSADASQLIQYTCNVSLQIYQIWIWLLFNLLTDIPLLSCSSKTNDIPIILSVIFLAVYVVVLVICRKADVSIQKTTGSFLLPENNPSDRFLYAVTIDTGFRSRTRMTAKVFTLIEYYKLHALHTLRSVSESLIVQCCQVHIVLYGDDSVSQTRELSSSDSKLFTCNSRNTFILR